MKMAKRMDNPGDVQWWHYRECDNGTYRVWNTTWGPDQFEVLTADQFRMAHTTFQLLSIPMTPAKDED